MKKWLTGKKFTTNEEVEQETNAYFSELPKSYYLEGIKKLEYRWTKCIELKGDYVEKYNEIYTKKLGFHCFFFFFEQTFRPPSFVSKLAHVQKIYEENIKRTISFKEIFCPTRNT